MKAIGLFLAFLGIFGGLKAQFKRGDMLVGGNFSSQASRNAYYNEKQLSFSPNFSYWSSSRWSHHWGLDYGQTWLNFSHGAVFFGQNIVANRVRYQHLYADYSLIYWARPWAGGKILPYTFAEAGLGIGCELFKNTRVSQENWTYNSRLNAGLALFWRVNTRWNVDFQLSLVSVKGNYSLDRQKWKLDSQLNPFQNSCRLGFFYRLSK